MTKRKQTFYEAIMALRNAVLDLCGTMATCTSTYEFHHAYLDRCERLAFHRGVHLSGIGQGLNMVQWPNKKRP